jgi:hypothetical protein
MNNEVEIKWSKDSWPNFKVSTKFVWGKGEKSRKSSARIVDVRPRFEPGTSRPYVRSVPFDPDCSEHFSLYC